MRKPVPGSLLVSGLIKTITSRSFSICDLSGPSGPRYITVRDRALEERKTFSDMLRDLEIDLQEQHVHFSEDLVLDLMSRIRQVYIFL